MGKSATEPTARQQAVVWSNVSARNHSETDFAANTEGLDHHRHKSGRFGLLTCTSGSVDWGKVELQREYPGIRADESPQQEKII